MASTTGKKGSGGDESGLDIPQDERGNSVSKEEVEVTEGTDAQHFYPTPTVDAVGDGETSINQAETVKEEQEGGDVVGGILAPRRSVTEEFEKGSRQPPQPKRTRTAPMERPTLGTKRSTWRSGLSRVSTRNMHESRDSDFQYRFQDVSSDSDSSLSSGDEEDGMVMGKKKVVKAGTDEKDERGDGHDGVEEVDQQPDEDGQNQGQGQQQQKTPNSSSKFSIGNDFFKTKGRVSRRDGRLKISINETTNSGYLTKALGQSIRNHLDIPIRDKDKAERPQAQKRRDEKKKKSKPLTLYERLPPPRLNIVVMVIGSRGDIQPFLKVGRILREQHGHRVRVASHPTFRDFVTETGLEFFSVGGDPSELMAFMVKNPGLIPNMQTVRDGEISKRRTAMAEMFEGFWRACVNTTEGERDKENLKMMDVKDPFVADAIIANPPSMAHVHIAEKLGIPLHMMFTFPYSPTTQFPHPLANIKMKKSNVDENYVNFMSYSLVELLTWQGLGDIVNKFRENTLKLEPVSSLWAPGALYRMKVPYTYMWSPSLVEKPKDWGPEIDIAGFVFLDLASNFQPSQELSDFLDAGDPPIYIGFGSIVVDDPDRFTEMIFEATKAAGVRALVNKGWGGIGADNESTPDHIFMLGNTPHDWLFPRVKAVVHHGGAGTTAIGLKCGKPTMIVPFFGDQPFWGAMVAEAKAGAHECIPYKQLTAERFAEGIKQCLTDEAQQNVQTIADSIANEGDGAENAVKSFHASLPLSGNKNMRCSILQERVAVWRVHQSSLRLSALAASMLHKENKLKWSDLKLAHVYEWNDFDGPGEPITGGVGALTDSLYGIGEGFGMVPVRIAKHIRMREEHERRKRERLKRKQAREMRKVETAAAKSWNSSTGTNPVPVPDHHAESSWQDNGRPPAHRAETTDTMSSALSADPAEPLEREVIEDLNWGIKRAGAAILTMPNDLHVAIAQGLHNAPRLYGDATVRKPVRITGVKSGFRAARREFGYGLYDACTGLVKQPKGDWEDGETLPAKFAGLGTGIGKGLGGFVLKTVNGVWAPPGYMVKGVIKAIENRHEGAGGKTFLRRAQVTQGSNDLTTLETSGDAERTAQVATRVAEGWGIYQKIWDEQHRAWVGGGLVRKWRVQKEKRLWDVNGALEDVDTVGLALEMRKSGQEWGRFGERKERMQRARLGRESSSEVPGWTEERVGDGGGGEGVIYEEEEEEEGGDEEGEASSHGEEANGSAANGSVANGSAANGSTATGSTANGSPAKRKSMNGSAMPVRSHTSPVT